MIYLDAAATTPVAQAVAAAMGPHVGRRERTVARAALEARLRAALGAERVVLTSGATEANALALRAAVVARPGRRRLVSQPTEHPSVRGALEALARERDLELRWLELDAHGRVELDAAARAFDDRTALASVMLGNHETGVVQPVAALGALARAHGALLHVDAVQGARHLDARLDVLGADLVVVTAHKLDGPRGCGAVALGPRATSLELGPASTPALALVAGLVAALERRSRLRAEDAPATAAARDALQAAVLGRVAELEPDLARAGPRALVVGGGAERLPGHLALALPGLSGEALVAWLDLEAGIAASSGAACAAGAAGPPSAVLRALGLPAPLARGSLRLTLPGPLRPGEIDRVARAVADGAAWLRALAPPEASRTSG